LSCFSCRDRVRARPGNFTGHRPLGLMGKIVKIMMGVKIIMMPADRRLRG
jgi:hypothetical protein